MGEATSADRQNAHTTLDRTVHTQQPPCSSRNKHVQHQDCGCCNVLGNTITANVLQTSCLAADCQQRQHKLSTLLSIALQQKQTLFRYATVSCRSNAYQLRPLTQRS
jgi:hypothetical protein